MPRRLASMGGFASAVLAAVLIGLPEQTTAASPDEAGGDPVGAEGASLVPVDDTIDFGRDVQPLLRAFCIDCHGPKEPKNGFRLDRRNDAMQGGTSTMIAPGNSAASRLYLKLLGDQYGPQMPPDGPLEADEIETIRRWIDEGAIWPDALAGEVPVTTPDPEATEMMDALRRGDQEAFRRMLLEDPAIVKRQGPGGSTPLMAAVLYADADAVRQVIDAGADVNTQNDAGATALMWAIDDLEKTRILVDSGANVNAHSHAGRTPLLIAAGRHGAGEVAKLLLEHGADPSVVAPSYRGPVTALRLAAEIGDESRLRLLIEKKANPKACGPLPFVGALNANSGNCADLLISSSVPAPMNMALLFVAPPFGSTDVFGDATTVRRLIERGADVNARDEAGRTVLMLAASLDTLPVETVKTLLEHGADVNAKAADGKTALDFARRHGRTPIVDLLVQAGASDGASAGGGGSKAAPAASARAAIERSIPLLQRVDASFLQTTGCVSCHHNSLTAISVSLARTHGIPVDDALARQQVERIGTYIHNWRERVLQDSAIPGDTFTISFIMLGLAAEGYAPDEATDALALYVKRQQRPEGYWTSVAHRPPLESNKFLDTAISLRGLQVYGVGPRQAEFEGAINRAADWLRRVEPKTTIDRAFQLLGLHWAGEDDDLLRQRATDLLTLQHQDGGWSSLPTLESDAYATGLVLYALHESGVAATESDYRRGVEFLMSTQCEDGSWHVASRVLPFQPYFESGFPHGHDQWISAAATNWAVMALVPAVR